LCRNYFRLDAGVARRCLSDEIEFALINLRRRATPASKRRRETMNQKIRVIKRGDEKSKEPGLNRSEPPYQPNARDITITIKQWVSDFKARRQGQVLKLN
jgi:hypothetical protein